MFDRVMTVAETRLCKALAAGDVASFNQRRKIRAGVIRNLVLGLPLKPHISEDEKASSKKSKPKERYKIFELPAGLRIKNAKFDGRLHLDVGRNTINSGLCLEFEDCLFVGGISAPNACFGHVKFQDCSFEDGESAAHLENLVSLSKTDYYLSSTVYFHGVEIQGDLWIEGNRPASDDDHLYWNLVDAKIFGGLDIRDSFFKARLYDGKQFDGSLSYASFNLSSGFIESDVAFLNGFKSKGTIGMQNLEIGGDAWFLGIEVDSSHNSKYLKPKQSLRAQGIRVHGYFCVRAGVRNRSGLGEEKPSDIVGDVFFYGAKIDGTLEFSDCNIRGSIDCRMGELGALLIKTQKFDEVLIRGSLWCNPITVNRNVEIGTAIDALGYIINLSHSVINGSLDLTHLVFKRRQGNTSTNRHQNNKIDLSHCTVGGPIIVSPDFDRSPELIRVRSKKLDFLGGYTLIESLWRVYYANKEPENVEFAFLVRGADVRVLNGQSNVFHSLLDEISHEVDQGASVRDYVKLFCKYISADEGSFTIVDSPESLAAYSIHHAEIANALRLRDIELKEKIKKYESISNEDMDASAQELGEEIEWFKTHLQELSDSLNVESIDKLPSDWFEFKSSGSVMSEDGAKIKALVLYGYQLFQASFTVKQKGEKGLNVAMDDDDPKGVILEGGARRLGAQYRHGFNVENLDTTENYRKFVTPATLDDMEEVKGQELKNIQHQLLPIVGESFSASKNLNEVILEDAKCDTLDDSSGGAWGENVLINMRRFRFNHSSWDLKVSSPQTRLAAFFADLGRNYLPIWILKLLSEKDKTILRSPRNPWECRRDWLDFNYKNRRYERQEEQIETCRNIPAHRREMIWGSFDPQPFEQLIRNSRNEGREDYATRFEIDKRDIEWRRRAYRNKSVFFGFAILALVAWTYITFVGTAGDTFDAFKPLLFLVAVHLSVALEAFALILNRNDETSEMWRPPSADEDKSDKISDKIRNRLNAVISKIPTALKDAGKTLFRPTPGWALIIGTVLLYVASKVPFFTDVSDPLLIASGLCLMTWGITYLSYIVNVLIRFGFGYLKRPVRAIGTLFVAFLLGWWGVAYANSARMLVVTVMPVAPLLSEADNRILIGGELVNIEEEPGRIASNIYCGDAITEPLYALDILIPLIDLKQEMKCEIGLATLPVSEDEVEARPAGFVGEKSFWSTIKAFYTVLGWVIVSLLILTFSFSFRTKSTDT